MPTETESEQPVSQSSSSSGPSAHGAIAIIANKANKLETQVSQILSLLQRQNNGSTTIYIDQTPAAEPALEPAQGHATPASPSSATPIGAQDPTVADAPTAPGPAHDLYAARDLQFILLVLSLQGISDTFEARQFLRGKWEAQLVPKTFSSDAFPFEALHPRI